MGLYYKGHPSWRVYLHFIIPALVCVVFAAALMFLKHPPQLVMDVTIFIVKGLKALHIVGTSAQYLSWVYTGFLGLSLLLFLVAAINRLFLTYYVDGEEVISRSGILSIKVRTIRVSDIRSTKYDQSLYQRLFNIGDIVFSSAADLDDDVYFFSVNDPRGILKKVDYLRSNYEDDHAGAPTLE